jgi:adenosylmethionine-8-amino-7-oxononanoate aminotransferase
LGAVGAVELDHDFDVGEARARFIERGVFLRPIGRTIYLAPPYVTDESDLSLLVQAITTEIAFQEEHGLS